MTLFALYQWIYINDDEVKTPVFVGIFYTEAQAREMAKAQEIINPDIRPVTVGEYISPY